MNEPEKQQEPVAWLCECSPQDWNELNSDERSIVIWNKDSLRDYEADGYTITPFYTTPPTAALAARQMRDAAAQKCIELMHKQTTHEAVEAICEAGKAIAALPVPEVQWRDLTDDEIKQAAWGYVEDSKNLDKQRMLFARAVIAAFKEKNK